MSGIQHQITHAPKPVSFGWKWMLRITRSAIRKMDTESTAAAGSARSGSGAWLSSADYAARGERGEPRGRNSGGGSGARNPTWPTRAEGEKRFRSATRNPYAAIHKVA